MSDAPTRTWRLERGSAATASAAADCIAAENLQYRGRNETDAAQLVEIFDTDPALASWARDVVVARMGTAVAGIAWVTSRGGTLAIDPARDRPGLRGELLAWIEHREAERRVGAFTVTVPALIGPTVAALEQAGYVQARAYIELALELGAGDPPAPWPVPDGYHLAPVDPRGDARRLHVLDQRAFGERPDFVPSTLPEFERRHLHASGFSPVWSRILEGPDGRPAASLLGAARPGRSAGYVDVLAVDPAHRRRGLGSTLLRAAFAAMRADRRPAAELHVASDNPGAMALYRSLGMVEQERIIQYTRPR